ncbi:MAG: hypothetical protein M1457_07205 [bacterium]|nr:hypothetical protein [bacterium]
MEGFSPVWTEWLMLATLVAGMIYWGVRMRRVASTLEGSFLANRRVPGIIASFSTVATNLNVNDFIGGAGFAYGMGVVVAHGGLYSGLALLITSLFLMPRLRRMNAMTLGDWLGRRYTPAVAVAYSVIWSVIWMLFNLGLYLYGGALVLHSLCGWNLYLSIIVLSLTSVVFTLMGGFGAVVIADVVQLAMMFFPFVILAVSVWTDIGGPAKIAAMLPPDKGQFWTFHTPFGALPVMLGGIFLMSMSYWSCEAQVVQRPLATRSEEDATISYLGATFWFVVLVPLVITLPALAAVHMFPKLENPDFAMISLVHKYIPHGLLGITVVGLMSGFFSSANAQINSFCTMFTSAVYKPLLVRNRTDDHYLRASKTAGVIFTLAAIGTALLTSTNEKGMFLFAISILATIMPPFGAITMLGALSRRVNRQGALLGLSVGGILAVVLIVLDLTGHLKNIGENSLYFRTLTTFVVTWVVTYVGSLPYAVPEPSPERIAEGRMTRPTSRVIRMMILMIAASIGMLLFWTVYFK